MCCRISVLATCPVAKGNTGLDTTFLRIRAVIGRIIQRIGIILRSAGIILHDRTVVNASCIDKDTGTGPSGCRVPDNQQIVKDRKWIAGATVGPNTTAIVIRRLIVGYDAVEYSGAFHILGRISSGIYVSAAGTFGLIGINNAIRQDIARHDTATLTCGGVVMDIATGSCCPVQSNHSGSVTGRRIAGDLTSVENAISLQVSPRSRIGTTILDFQVLPCCQG